MTKILNTTAGQYESPYGTTEEAWKSNIPGTTLSVLDQGSSPYGSTETGLKSNMADANVAVPQPQTEQATTETPVTTDSPSIEVRLTQQGSNAKASNPGGKTKGQEETVTSPWAGGFQAGLDSNPDMSINEAINSYNGWAKENGNDPLDIMQIYTVLNGNDPMKSMAQNERERKREENREKWASTVNMLSHLGNFIGTLAGAPDQGIESSAEFTKRQQLLHDKTLEQRRQMSNDYLKVYQAQQASELAKAKEARAQQQQDRLDAELFLKQKQLEWKMMESEGKMDLARRKQELEETKVEIMRQVQMGRLSQGAARIALAQMNYDLRAAGSTTTTTKPGGEVQVTVKTPGTQGTGAPAANNGGGRNLGIGLSQTR